MGRTERPTDGDGAGRRAGCGRWRQARLDPTGHQQDTRPDSERHFDLSPKNMTEFLQLQAAQSRKTQDSPATTAQDETRQGPGVAGRRTTSSCICMALKQDLGQHFRSLAAACAARWKSPSLHQGSPVTMLTRFGSACHRSRDFLRGEVWQAEKREREVRETSARGKRGEGHIFYSGFHLHQNRTV